MDRWSKMAAKVRERKGKKSTTENSWRAHTLHLNLFQGHMTSIRDSETRRHYKICKVLFTHSFSEQRNLWDLSWMISSFVDYSSPPVLQFTSVGVRYQERCSNKPPPPRNYRFLQILWTYAIFTRARGEVTLMSGILMSMRGQCDIPLSFIECDLHLILNFYRLVSTTINVPRW